MKRPRTMRPRDYALLLAGLAAVAGLPAGCATDRESATGPAGPAMPGQVHAIAFGSCARQDLEQPVWEAMVDTADPDVLVLLGDNIYADTEDEAELRAKYARFAAVPGFAAVRRSIPILATWDDHDYGANDAGAEYPMKAVSQRVMLDFFGEPADSDRRRTPGVYDAQVVGPVGRRVQFILLDARYFRSPYTQSMKLTKAERERLGGRYKPTEDAGTTVLGQAQWRWLERELRRPAELRIIASSVQFVAEDHRWESWSLFPHERRRMIDLIDRTGATGVVFITGDRHAAEISRLDEGVPYPLYDVTASSLTHSLSPRPEPNRWRVGERSFANNFGLITIDWDAADPTISLQIRDEAGEMELEHTLTLGQLRGGGPDR